VVSDALLKETVRFLLELKGFSRRHGRFDIQPQVLSSIDSPGVRQMCCNNFELPGQGDWHVADQARSAYTAVMARRPAVVTLKNVPFDEVARRPLLRRPTYPPL